MSSKDFKCLYKLRKLRTGKFVTAMAGVLLLGTLFTSKVDASVAGYDTVSTPDKLSWKPRTVEEVKAEIGDLSKPYVIKWGDTLFAIQEASGIDMNKIASDNGIKDMDLIYTGNVLYAKDGYTAIGNAETGEVKVYQEQSKVPAANTCEDINEVDEKIVSQDVTNKEDEKVQEIKKDVQKELERSRDTVGTSKEPTKSVEQTEAPTTTTTTTEARKPAEKPVEVTTPVATTEAPTTTTTTTEAPKPAEKPVEVTTPVATTEAPTTTTTTTEAPKPTEKPVEVTTPVATTEAPTTTTTTTEAPKPVVKPVETGTKAQYFRYNEDTKKYATLESLDRVSDAELSDVKDGNLQFKQTGKTLNAEFAKQLATYGNQHLDVMKVNTEFAKLMNAERAKKGLKPLAVNDTLVRLAEKRSTELTNQSGGASIYVNGKAHVRLDGRSYATVFDEDSSVKRYGYKGENLLGNIEVIQDGKNFLNETRVAEILYKQWAESPGHYANMMSEAYDDFGVGIEYGATSNGYGSYTGVSAVGTQLFGGRVF